jgi:hypothetical protein
MRRSTFLTSGLVTAATIGNFTFPSVASTDPTVCQSGQRTIDFESLVDNRPLVERSSIFAVENDVKKIAELRLAFSNMYRWSRNNPNDPRCWPLQSAIHRIAGLRGATDPTLTIHSSFYFLPWHRAYLYFFERILAWHLATESTMDANFRLPIWNWDITYSELKVPTSYTTPEISGQPNPLYTLRGDSSPFEPNDTNPTDALGSAADDFFGSSPATGLVNPGAPFSTPHGAVHEDTGGVMMDPRTSAEDPIFFSHHANVDKLWAWWLSGSNHTAPDYLEWKSTVWTFTDWDGTCVSVKASDMIDEKRMRYYYAPSVEIIAKGPQSAHALALESGRLTTTDQARSAVRKATHAQLRLVRVRVDGPGRYFVTTPSSLLPGYQTVLGSFVVFGHADQKLATVYVPIYGAKSALTASQLRLGIHKESRSRSTQQRRLAIAGSSGTGAKILSATPTELPQAKLRRLFGLASVSFEPLEASGATLLTR